MSKLQKMKYCREQIKIIEELLLIETCSFYQRALARMIILRLYDIIRFGRQLNNQIVLSNKTEIKNHLNALSDLYEEFLKKQRDKLSGHVQDDVDFGTRIELWMNIDCDVISFFINAAFEAYSYFNVVNDYEPIEPLGLDAILLEQLKKTSSELNIEDGKPRISTDILGLTRAGTSGLLLVNDIQAKFGALNLLELLIRYEQKMADVGRGNNRLKHLFVEMLIVDVVNYIDNFVTRTVIPGAKQEMAGLDQLLIRQKFPEAKKIIEEWKNLYKYEPIVQNYRNIRNKIGAHIDDILTISDIKSLIENVDLEQISNFLRNIFDLKRKICLSQLEFKLFATNSELMGGVTAVSNNIATPFDKSQNATLQAIDPNYTMDDLWDMWLNNQYTDEVRSRFWNLVVQPSEVVKSYTIQVEEERHNREAVIVHKEIHQFLTGKIIGAANKDEKIAVFNLLQQLTTSDPGSLIIILLNVYKKIEEDIKLPWLYTIGEVGSKRVVPAIDILKKQCGNTSWTVCYHAVLALFKIDIKSNGIQYLNKGSKETLSDSISSFLHYFIEKLSATNQIIFSLTLLSEIYFSRLVYFKEYAEIRYSFLNTIYLNSVKSYIESQTKEPLVDVALSNLINCFNHKNYILCAIFISEILSEVNHDISRLFLNIGDELIQINDSHEQSVYYKALIKKKLNQKDEAICILKYLVKISPESVEAKIALLEVYFEKNDVVAFTKLKDDILKHYSLTNEQKLEIEKLDRKMDQG